MSVYQPTYEPGAALLGTCFLESTNPNCWFTIDDDGSGSIELHATAETPAVLGGFSSISDCEEINTPDLCLVPFVAGVEGTFVVKFLTDGKTFSLSTAKFQGGSSPGFIWVVAGDTWPDVSASCERVAGCEAAPGNRGWTFGLRPGEAVTLTVAGRATEPGHALRRLEVGRSNPLYCDSRNACTFTVSYEDLPDHPPNTPNHNQFAAQIWYQFGSTVVAVAACEAESTGSGSVFSNDHGHPECALPSAGETCTEWVYPDVLPLQVTLSAVPDENHSLGSFFVYYVDAAGDRQIQCQGANGICSFRVEDDSLGLDEKIMVFARFDGDPATSSVGTTDSASNRRRTRPRRLRLQRPARPARRVEVPRSHSRHRRRLPPQCRPQRPHPAHCLRCPAPGRLPLT